MKSILENRPALAREVNQVAEVAGYLWQKGWAERNGGNITLNITEYIDDEIRSLPAISEVKQIGKKTSFSEGMLFLLQRDSDAHARFSALAHGEWLGNSYSGRLFQLCDYCR